MNKEFDIVVHGATGFTGRLVVEYLMARYPQGAGATVRWAMGGRSAEKLAAVRDEIGAPRDTPLVVTDGTDVASLRALTDRTRLVLTTVGPYQLYGNELVAACAASGVPTATTPAAATTASLGDRSHGEAGHNENRQGCEDQFAE